MEQPPEGPTWLPRALRRMVGPRSNYGVVSGTTSTEPKSFGEAAAASCHRTRRLLGMAVLGAALVAAACRGPALLRNAMDGAAALLRTRAAPGGGDLNPEGPVAAEGPDRILVLTAVEKGCGLSERNYDYRSGKLLYQIKFLRNFELCRDKCEKEPLCVAWTWGVAPWDGGRRRSCSLQQLDLQTMRKPRKLRKLGAVSGLPCHQGMVGWGRAPALAPVPAVSNQSAGARCGVAERDVDLQTKRDLYQLAPIPDAETCRQKCEDETWCRVWTWGKKRGAPNTCSLKRLAQGEKPVRQPRSGTASGVPCHLFHAQPQAASIAAGRGGLDGSGGPVINQQLLAEPHDPPLEPLTETGLADCDLGDIVGSAGKLLVYVAKAVLSETACRRRCEADVRCHAWTWGKRVGVAQTENACFLKIYCEPVITTAPRAEVAMATTTTTTTATATTITTTTITTAITTTKTMTRTSTVSTSTARPTTTARAETASTTTTRTKTAKPTSTTRVTTVAGASSASRGKASSTTTHTTTTHTTTHTATHTATTSTTTRTTTSTVTRTTTTTTTTTTTATTTRTTTSRTTTTTTSATTTTTSSITSTTTTVTTLQMVYAPHSLYCFLLIVPRSYEQDLLVMQHTKRTSIFGCDEFRVFSNESIKVAPGVVSSIVQSDLKCQIGGEFKTALNREIFKAVWDKVVQESRFKLHDWTVKVDADTVFFPDRLHRIVSALGEGLRGVYLNNCKFGLHGPIEVFSRNAVFQWTSGEQRCVDHFHGLCAGPCRWGEDMFIDQCLMKVLLVERGHHGDLLVESHCDPPAGWQECRDRTKVSFHPFKTVDGYAACLANSGWTPPSDSDHGAAATNE